MGALSPYFTRIPDDMDCPPGPRELARDRCRRDRALSRIRADPLGWMVLGAGKLAHTFGYEATPALQLGAGLGWSDPASRRSVWLLAVPCTLFYWGLLGFAVCTRVRPSHRVIWAAVAGVALVHFLFVGGDRYHLPLVPLIAALAACAQRPRRRFQRQLLPGFAQSSSDESVPARGGGATFRCSVGIARSPRQAPARGHRTIADRAREPALPPQVDARPYPIGRGASVDIAPYLLMMTIPVAYHARRSPGGVVLQRPTRPDPAHSRALEPGASPAAGSCYAPSMQCYRAMKEAPDGLPVVEQCSRGLGVRVGIDLAPDESGAVHPGRGGMSVSPSSLWNVPPHRRPRRLGRGSTGKDADRVFWADSHVFPRHALVVRPDPNRPEQHAFVEPARTMVFEAYQEKLVATRSDWRDGEP